MALEKSKEYGWLFAARIRSERGDMLEGDIRKRPSEKYIFTVILSRRVKKRKKEKEMRS